jgi:outer membrane lipoprotein carrier protein
MIDILSLFLRGWLVMAPGAGSAAATATQPAASATVSAADAVGKVQDFYAKISRVTAQFRQEVRNATFGTSKTSDGKVWLSKPGKMRWDYYEVKKGGPTTTKKSFISNGTTLFVVEHDNKQVMKKDLKQDLLPVAVTFLYGKGDLKAEFNPALDTSGTYGGKDDIVLKLTPKQPSAQYKSLFLVVNKGDFHVSQSIIIDSSGNVNHFRFYSPDFEESIKDSWFEFDPKSVPNYRVVDADQQQAPAGSAAATPAPAKK